MHPAIKHKMLQIQNAKKQYSPLTKLIMLIIMLQLMILAVWFAISSTISNKGILNFDNNHHINEP